TIEKAAQKPRAAGLDVASCLFPREQGVTGINPSVLPASLTGRILFFCCLRTAKPLTTDLHRVDRLELSHPLAFGPPRLRRMLLMVGLRALGPLGPHYDETSSYLGRG